MNKFEKKLIRYIKFYKKEIKINDYEEKLFSALKYVNYLKESKHEIFYKKVKNTKVSFITTIFNQENYLSSFIFSVQNQKLKEYELIFVDDNSSDNGIKIINKIKEKDKRIKLIRNKINKGAFYSRYIGQLNSKSNYIIFFDCDDFVMEKGIFNSYNYIKKNNIDIIQFHTVRQDRNRIFISNVSYSYKNIIYQPYLSYVHYYNIKNKKGAEYIYALWDKLIKKDIANKAFKWIGKQYLKEKIVMHNDFIILFSFLRNANSYKYIDEIGYYYCNTNKNSASNSWKKYENSNEIIHSLFTNIKFLYERTGNNYLDKYICIYKIQKYYSLSKQLYKYLNDKELAFITKVLNKLIDSDYISIEDKSIIIMIKTLILKKIETHED
jgi:glycosyltransferase involved in cell wall biosynthesis